MFLCVNVEDVEISLLNQNFLIIIFFKHCVYEEIFHGSDNNGSSSWYTINVVFKHGHIHGNEQFATSNLFGDNNMLGDMVGNFYHSHGNAGLFFPANNYIVNIITPLD